MNMLVYTFLRVISICPLEGRMRRMPRLISAVRQQHKLYSLDMAPFGDGWEDTTGISNNNISMDLAYKYNISYFFIFCFWYFRFENGVTVHTKVKCSLDSKLHSRDDGWCIYTGSIHAVCYVWRRWCWWMMIGFCGVPLPSRSVVARNPSPANWLDRLLQSVYTSFGFRSRQPQQQQTGTSVRWWWHMMFLSCSLFFKNVKYYSRNS